MALTPTRRGVRLPGDGVSGQGLRRGAWALLVVLLVANLAAAMAAGGPAGDGPALPGDGPTYTLQAASVAFDLDLAWSRADHDRFIAARGAPPETVVLRSPDRGERITFGVPVPYALLTAPVVRLAPLRGLAVANALVLALAALLAAATLERRLGPAAPLWVAAFVFASVACLYTYRATPELFAASLVALAFAVAYRGEGQPVRRFTELYGGTLPGEEAGRRPWRWAGVGALTGTVAAFHPFYLALLLPLALAVPRGRRRAGGAVLIATSALVLAVWAAVYAAAGGSWLPWDRGGRVFTPETGFPAVDVPVALWPREEAAGPAWLPGGVPEELPGGEAPGRLAGWNVLFLAAGRHVGVLPYFAPLLLGFAAFLGERGRWAVPVAVGLALAGALILRPFDFAAGVGGGEAAMGNAFFLPLYPALWFLAGRPLRPLWVGVVAVLGALYLYPLWLSPGAAAQAGAAPSFPARHLLPVETTQAELPGVRDVQHGTVWVRLSRGAPESAPGELLIEPGRRLELWIGSPVPVPAFRLELGSSETPAPTRAEVGGAEALRTVLTPDGRVILELDPGGPDRRHPVAWSSRSFALYRLEIGVPREGGGGPLPFRVVPRYRAGSD